MGNPKSTGGDTKRVFITILFPLCYIRDSSTTLGQRCIMVASVAVAFPLHHSVGPALYNGWYTVAVAFPPHESVGPTVAVAFPSHHSVGPTLYNGCKQNQVMCVQTYYYEHDAGVTMVAFLCEQIDHFLKFVDWSSSISPTNFAFISSYALCHSE